MIELFNECCVSPAAQPVTLRCSHVLRAHFNASKISAAAQLLGHISPSVCLAYMTEIMQRQLLLPRGFRKRDCGVVGEEDLATMAQACFTSLVVVAPRLEPNALLSALLPLLKPSASVAVYASSLPPLAECFQKLQATHQFAALQVRHCTSIFLSLLRVPTSSACTCHMLARSLYFTQSNWTSLVYTAEWLE